MSIDYRAYPILYVDDETANLVTVQYLLEGSFELLTAHDGQEALHILAENEDIAVLLCDQRMPGMSGVEVCEKARDIRPDAVRILMTAYSDMHAAVDAINRGQVVRYIQKPFRNEELIGILQTAIYLVHVQRTVQELEVRLLQTGQNAAARTIEAQVGHELGNVLLGVDANILYARDLGNSALKALEDDPENAKNLLVELNAAHADSVLSLRRLKDMITRLKDGDQSRVQKARCHADRVVDSTVRILRNEIQKLARLQVIVEGTPSVPMDASLLGQVATNLLLNAAQAMQGKPPSEATIVIKVATANERALVSVSDNGSGIPDEHLDRIFDAHFTTKERGNGIGLAIVREMVREAGGDVRVETSPNGTTFTVDLPVVQSASVAPSSSPPDPSTTSVQ